MSNLQPLNAANRRDAERRSALDDYLCLVDLGDNRSAMLLDVSETGIGLQSVEGVGEGFTTTFRFQLPDTAVLVEGEGEIAWVDRAGRMGVRFTRIGDELKPELRNWVTSQANPLFAHQPETEEIADLDARDRVAQLEARIIVSGWAQIQALNFLVDQIAAMTQASGVAIAVEDGSGIICKASSGIAPQVGVRVNPRSGLSWECVRTKEVVTCVDTENDPRVDRLVCRELNMRSAMLVPVVKDHGVAGLVEVFSSRPHAFSNTTVILLKRVAEAVSSLDETAPDLSPEPVLQMPARQPEPQTAAPAPPRQEPPPIVEEKKPAVPPAPVMIKPAPQPAPVASMQPRPAAPAAPPVAAAPKPVPVAVTPAVPVVSAPAPVARPATPAAAPVTKLGIPFAQEVAAAKPVETLPLPVKQVDKAPPAVTAVSAAAAAPKRAEIAPVAPPVVVQPVQKPSPENIPAARPQPVAAPAVVKPPEPPVVKPPVREVETPVKPAMPAAATQEAAMAVKVAPEGSMEKPAPTAKVADAPPGPVRVPSKAAPLPAVAFSGAAATSPAKTFEVPPAVPVPPVPAFSRTAALEETPAAPEFDPEFHEKPDRRGAYISIAAMVMIALSAVAGWYWAHQAPVKPPAVPTSTQTSDVPAATTQAANLAAASATAPAVSSTPSPASSAPTTPKPPATGAPAAEKNPAPKSASQQPAAQSPLAAESSPPLTARTFAPAEQPAQPPSIPIAPPNTAGMATLLAGPVAAPTLSRSTVSQGVTGGKQILKVQPSYPSTARALRVSGIVTMTAHVAKNGSVTDIKILKGHPLLNGAAADAVKRWKYEPFLLNGQPIENDVNVQVKFEMPR